MKKTKDRKDNPYRNEAVKSFAHYFRTAFEGAGLNWNGDNDEEMEQMVDALLNAAADETEENFVPKVRI